MVGARYVEARRAELAGVALIGWGARKYTVNAERHVKPWPRASRMAGGGLLRLGQCTGPTRTTQGRRVGGLQPKLHHLGVAGEFGDVVESAENARRGVRVGLTASLGAHHTMASARIARRCRRRLAWRARMGGSKCTNSLTQIIFFRSWRAAALGYPCFSLSSPPQWRGSTSARAARGGTALAR